MKISVDIDCTPQEARTFFGLPDVQPLQEAMMAKLQEQMTDQMNMISPEELIKTWLVPGMENFSKLQQAMWQAATGTSKDKED